MWYEDSVRTPEWPILQCNNARKSTKGISEKVEINQHVQVCFNLRSNKKSYIKKVFYLHHFLLLNHLLATEELTPLQELRADLVQVKLELKQTVSTQHNDYSL